MKRSFRVWVCEACLHRDPYAHVQAIKELFMLVAGEITNKKCREFLCIQNPQLVTRILKDLNLTVEGTGKKTKYKMKLQE